MNKVGFIDASSESTVARQVLALAGAELIVWKPNLGEEDPAERAALEALADASLIFFTSPLFHCRMLARQLGDVITGRHVIVHNVRGVEPATLKTVSTILQEETPTQRVGFVTGPMRLDDLQEQRPGAAVCASLFPEVYDLVEEALMSPSFRVYRSQDIVGAEISAAYARVIALMSGLGQGLAFGESLQALLMARGLAEMARFVVFRDGYERTSFGLSGLGNLHLDTAAQGSPAFQLGCRLASLTPEEIAALPDTVGVEVKELLAILDAFYSVGTRARLDLPLLSGLHHILHQKGAANEVIQNLMSLPALYE